MYGKTLQTMVYHNCIRLYIQLYNFRSLVGTMTLFARMQIFYELMWLHMFLVGHIQYNIAAE